MTFTQLRTFALVAELGSLRAAAAALGVSEPAVSAAVAALRTDLGDPLFARTARASRSRPAAGRWPPGPASWSGWPTAPGGRSAHATSAGRLRVLATAACAEHVAGRGGRRVHPTGAAGRRRSDRRLDRLRGGRPRRGRRRHRAGRPAGSPRRRSWSTSVPFLRYARDRGRGTRVTASPDARLRPRLPWLPAPEASRPGSEEERWADRAGPAPDVERCDERGRGADRGARRRRA